MQREGLDTRMSKIAIVTDSNSGITQAEGKKMGIAGAALATVISQCVSAILVTWSLTRAYDCLLYTSDAADE